MTATSPRNACAPWSRSARPTTRASSACATATANYRWLYARGQLLLDEDGEPSRFIGTSSDITQRRADEESLRQAAVVFDSTLEGVLVTDRELKIVHVNPAFSRITGYSSDEVLGKSPNMFKSGRHDPDFYRSLWHALEQRGSWSGEIWNRRKGGDVFPIWQCIRSIHDENGNLSHYVAVFSDISAIKHSQQELDYLAHHDPLTSLPNRLLFGERIDQALQRARQDGRRGALLLVDLDHFKIVNESLGHNTGDQLLKLIGERLHNALGQGVTLARLGGDEFGLLGGDCARPSTPRCWHSACSTALNSRSASATRPCSSAPAFGISLFPDDGDSVEKLLRNADSALFRARAAGARPQLLQPGDDCPGTPAHQAGGRAAHGPGAGAAARALPADPPPGRRRDARRRGAGALAASGARPGSAGRVHPGGRRQRPDWRHRRLGAGTGLRADGALAGRRPCPGVRRGERLQPPVRPRRAGSPGRASAAPDGARPPLTWSWRSPKAR